MIGSKGTHLAGINDRFYDTCFEGMYPAMFDHSSMSHRPTQDDRVFAWAFIPSVLICQIAPHYFGFERFLRWRIETDLVWFFLAGAVALVFSFIVCGLFHLVFWYWDRRASNRDLAVYEKAPDKPKEDIEEATG